MSSTFKLNQLSLQQEIPQLEDSLNLLENRDKEIYALRQQIQTLKMLYTSSKTSLENFSLKKGDDLFSESFFSKQSLGKAMIPSNDWEAQYRTLHAETRLHQLQLIAEKEKEQEAKQTAIDEISALQAQLQSLKVKFSASQRLVKTQEEQIQELKDRSLIHQNSAEKLTQQSLEFKNLEEKFSQMKSLWKSLGQFFQEKNLSSSDQICKSLTPYQPFSKDQKTLFSSEINHLKQNEAIHFERSLSTHRNSFQAVD